MREATYLDQASSAGDGESYELPIAPVPYGFTPEGIAESAIDPVTLYLVEHAIPPNLGGRDLLVHLLYYATTQPQTTMQHSLFKETGESMDEAIALITSVEDLARSAGSRWAPETYSKVLLALEALGVIRRRFHRHYTEIRIFIGKRVIHIPSLLAELRNLHDTYSSRKVRQFAKRVAKRLKMGEFVAKITAISTGISPEQAPVLQLLVQVLKEHGVAAIKQQVLEQACMQLTTGRVHYRPGELQEDGTKQLRIITTQRGDSIASSGEFVPVQSGEGSEHCAPENQQKGDSIAINSPEFACSRKKRHSCPTRSGDLDTIFAMNSPESDVFGPIGGEKGEFVAGVSIIGLSPDKIITNNGETIIDATSKAEHSASSSTAIPVEDRPLEEIRREAKFYESFFDNGRSRHWTGSLIKLIRETTKDARRLAAVGAIYYSYFPQPDGRTVYSPGGWFTSACRRYSQPGAAIPAEVRVWSETNLPLKEIRRRVKEGSRLPSQVALPWENGQETAGLDDVVESNEQWGGPPPDEAMAASWEDMSAEASAPVETAYPLPFATTSACMGSWMDYGQAERLRDRIMREGAMYSLRAVVRPDQGARYTVIVTWPGRPGEIEIINEEDWTDYFSEVKECFDELG